MTRRSHAPRRRPGRLLHAALSGLLIAAGVALVSSPSAAAQEAAAVGARAVAATRISPELAAALAAAAPDERVTAYAVLSEPLSFEALDALGAGLASRERRAVVVDALKAHAAHRQSGLRSQLVAAAAAGRAANIRELWMGNAVIFEATPEVIAALALRPEVQRLQLSVDHGAAAYQDAVWTGPRGPAAPLPVGAAVALPGAGVAAASAGYPFEDDFESGTLGPAWTVTTTGGGYVAVTSEHGPLGDFHVVMATSVNGQDATAAMTLSLDLTGERDVGLAFWHKEFADEDHPEDGVFVSADGNTWHLALSLQGSPSVWTQRFVQLDQVIATAGIAYTSEFRIRFQWRDNFDIPSDGFAFDGIRVAPGIGTPPLPPAEPNLVALQAPALWELGYRGEGIVVASIDSGVWTTHPDLVNRLWHNPGEIPGNGVDDDGNGKIDDVHGWDFIGNTANVSSTDPHGTNSAGIVMGDGSSGGKLTGMAPGATLLACKVSTEAQFWLAQQYCLEQGVDVITSSYSYKWINVPKPDYHMHRALSDVQLAAGIVHANSIGNQGQLLTSYPIPFNIAAPANNPSPWAHPALPPGGRSSVIACGGIELNGDALYAPSGRGPAAWEAMSNYLGGYPHAQNPLYWDYPHGGFGGGQPGLIKPDLVAYTTNIQTPTVGLGYTGFGGTSAATPHLGGALALLRQVQPQAEPRHLDGALQLTAVDLGDPGRDNIFGAGKLQVADAARRLLVLVRSSSNEPGLGEAFDLDLFGLPNSLLYAWFSPVLLTGPAAFNLAPPFFELGVFALDGTGAATLPLLLPNDPILVDVQIWFQVAAPNTLPQWGVGPLISVPEWITIAP